MRPWWSRTFWNPPKNDKYNRLKETLIARFTDSQEYRCKYFYWASSLVTKNRHNCYMEWELSQERMPSRVFCNLLTTTHAYRIQEMLLIFDGTNLDKLTEWTSSKNTLHGGRPCIQATSTNYQDSMQQLIKTIEQMAILSTQVEKLTKQSRARSRSKNRTRLPGTTPQQKTQVSAVTTRDFGDQARKCTPPCNA